MRHLKKFFTTSFYFLFCALFICINSIATSASDWEQFVLSEDLLDFYNANGITAYSPSNYSATCIPGNNMDYSGGQILTEAELNQILNLQPIYEQAASQYGFSWQILATLHYMERSNKLESPSNGQGVYQLYSYTQEHGNFPSSGTLSESEFLEQSLIAAEQIATRYGAGLDLSTSDGVKTMFFKFNGTASIYKQRALQLGFDQAGADRGEGSPYVMNKADSLRDPLLNPAWRGAYVKDHVWDSTHFYTRYGAYPIYVSLGGNDDSGLCYPAAGGGILIEGGMTLDQANAYMEQYRQLEETYSAATYGSLPNANSALTSDYGMLNYGGNRISNIHNCTAFTKYFIKESTNSGTIYKDALGNGGQVVGNLLSRYPQYFEDGGTTPRPYAIFSTASGSTQCDGGLCGHTGVVLGIDTERGKIIIGQAGYNKRSVLVDTNTGQGRAYEYDLSTYTSGNYKYAYPKNLIFDDDNTDIITDGDVSVSTSGDIVNLTIPGLSKSYKIAWVSDAHVQSKDDGKTDTDRFEGRTIDQINQNWENAINTIINTNPKYDAVIFGGDLMDYYSNNTSSIIQSGLDKITQKGIPWLYLYGGNDHDQNGGSGSIFKNQPIDLGDIVIIGLDNSSSNSVDASSTIRLIDSYSKPIILATHVPFDDPNGSVNQKVTSARSTDYLWTAGGSRWDLNSNSSMNTLVNNYLYQNSNVKLVLAGHVHTLSHTSQLGNGAQEHIFQGNYRGNGIGVINIRGN